MALSDESRAELLESVADMRLLDETVKTDGWQKIIEPLLKELRRIYFVKLMEAQNLPELFLAQSAIKSIDIFISDKARNVESDIDRRLREGKEAAEILAKEKIA